MSYLSNSDLTHIMERRKQLGLTQAELAQLSNISVPSIQLIESGRVNPSFVMTQALFDSLGIEIIFENSVPNWNELAAMGVPIADHPKKIEWRGKESELFIRRAYFFVRQNSGFSKEREALEAYLIAMRDHFPKKFRALRNLEPHLPRKLSGRLIKLRRIALSYLARIF